MADYSYQTHSADKILKDALDASTEAAVLAATPGSGKTTISQIVIQKYIQKYPNAKVLVLTHGQNLLKNQYLDSLRNPNVQIDFTFNDFFSDYHALPQVLVGLPHSIKRLPWDEIDLLVVDECHEFYLKTMVQKIIKNLKPKHQVLLTGSPAEFNRLKNLGKRYKMTYVCGDDLVKNDVFSAVEMDVVKLNNSRNVNITNTVQKMIDRAKYKNKNLSKLMVAVNSIRQANSVSEYLRSIGRKVALSTSKNDRENEKVKEFKQNQYDTLVVVQRGILGFSDNNITSLFDLRCSANVDISNQIFARVLRKHPENIQKFYCRCGNQNTKDFNNQVVMLHKIKSLMRKEIFTKYDGTNMTVRIS